MIAYQADFGRLVERAFEKIGQSADGMRTGRVSGYCSTKPKASSAANLRSVDDPADRHDVTDGYDAVLAVVHRHRCRTQPGIEPGVEADGP